ncbi:MAG: DUF362 domain-containing protein [Clostridia bacterium]|nr:DUF362 domain-containing protein [Clostridia bacterium]
MANVYFTREITPEAVLRLYELLIAERGAELKAPVAVKVHSGEAGNQNFLRPEFFAPTILRSGGVVTECNTAYEGARNTTERHVKTLAAHGWSKHFEVDLLDAEGPDLCLPISGGAAIDKNYVGKNIKKYASALVLSHFKGHPMGGYGGALKQLSIGFASSYGKKYIHGVGDIDNFWGSDHDSFLAAMADAAKSVVEYFSGEIVYINVMKNMSVDCDCCAKAEDPCIADIGILASLDPVAIDRACLDLVYASDDPGRDHLIERIESRNGAYTVECAERLGIGSTKYTLKEV